MGGAVAQHYRDAAILLHGNKYVRMKHDLLRLGQVSRLFSSEFRSYQAMHSDAFINVEELPGYLSVFFPNTDPNSVEASQYRGRRPFITFPSDHNTTWDILPFMQFLVRTCPRTVTV